MAVLKAARGDTDDYANEMVYRNTAHKITSEMFLGLVYGVVNPHTLCVIILSCA